MGNPDNAQPTGGDAEHTGSHRLRGGVRHGDVNFDAELRRYLQRRLRVVLTAILVVGPLLLVVSLGLAAMSGEWSFELLTTPATLLHAAALVFFAVILQILRTRRLSLSGLRLVDVCVMSVLVLGTLGVYEADYATGVTLLPAILGLFLVLRALIVPSSPRRTLCLSLPAPIGVLAIQLMHGDVYAWAAEEGGVFPADRTDNYVIWCTVILLVAVAMSMLASRLNFALRLKAFEAKRLDQYVIEGVLGRGAMGEVYQATHALMRRPTAIKLVRPGPERERMLLRFEREVRMTSRLTHPNTIRIYDYGRTADGLFFYTMELLDGADLEHIVHMTGPMPPARVIHILQQVCGALHEAHEKDLVHRDVKPSNLLLCTQGLDRDVVKVMDFGLVKETTSSATSLTGDGAICGSPETIAPEAVGEGEVTRRSDLYSLGIVGCMLLTGRPPYDASNTIEFLMAHMQKDPTAPSECREGVPADLERVLMHCLEKDPGDRPETARAVREALLACADAGTWTQADAETWWTGHGAEVERKPTAVPRPDDPDDTGSSGRF